MLPFKLPNAASYKITVTSTATGVLDLIETAAGEGINFRHDLSMVELQPEFGDIRYTDSGDVPTASNGILIADGETRRIEAAPVDVNLIATLGSVVCNVRVGWNRPNNS